MIKFKLLCLLTMISFSSLSQNSVIKPNERVQLEKKNQEAFKRKSIFVREKKQNLTGLPPELKNYVIFSLDKADCEDIREKQPNTLALSIPNGPTEIIELELVKSEFKTSDYQVVDMPSGRVISTSKNAHYMGIVKGDETSLVALSFLHNQIMGFVSHSGENGNLVIGKLQNSDQHIVYNDIELDTEVRSKYICKAADMNVPVKKYDVDVLNGVQQKAISNCPRIYFDLSTAFINSQGGSTNAANYVDGVFNQTVVLYANENINILTSGSAAWSSSQPFANDLTPYMNFRNSQGFNGDLGHLITASGGGVAFLGGICSPIYNYGLSGFYGAYYTVPTYSWSVSTLAHELGHNFGSQHTHACAWNGNYTAIDGCYYVEGNCATPGIPSNGGTIMSYCHLTSVGVNLNHGFGQQPGNVIRNTISYSSCLTSCNYQEEVQDCSTAPEYQSGMNYPNGSYIVYENNLYQLQNNVWVFIEECASQGSGLCYTAPTWQSGIYYSAGSYVKFSNNIYLYDGFSWSFVQTCTSTGDNLCNTSPQWQEGTFYSYGDYVIYNGIVYQYNGSDWDYVQSCTSSMPASFDKAPLPEELSVSIFPNPMVDNIINVFVTGEEIKEYAVYSQRGDLIQKGQLINGVIAFESLPKGMYIIKLTTSQESVIRTKFIKN